MCASWSDPLQIMTWPPNVLAWNGKLGVTAFRMGCTDAPKSCLEEVRSLKSSQKINRFSIMFDSAEFSPEKFRDFAWQYSKLSLKEPALIEIGLDDFVSLYSQVWNPDSNLSFEAVLEATRKVNPNLKFGITIYEDELSSQVLDDSSLPNRAKAKIDTVYLYLHYRENGKNFANYVKQAERIFQKAKIIAGSYAYDRIDYSLCSSEETSPKCTPEEEITLFKESIRLQADLLREGRISGIEFYPGFFGMEEQWDWNDPETCRPERKAECIKNTKIMRQAALQALFSVRKNRKHPNVQLDGNFYYE